MRNSNPRNKLAKQTRKKNWHNKLSQQTQRTSSHAKLTKQTHMQAQKKINTKTHNNQLTHSIQKLIVVIYSFATSCSFTCCWGIFKTSGFDSVKAYHTVRTFWSPTDSFNWNIFLVVLRRHVVAFPKAFIFKIYNKYTLTIL